MLFRSLADHDHKRLHYFHEMVHAADGWLAATNELLAMHVDMASRKSMPFPDRVAARLAAVQSAHAALSPPAQLGRRLGIRRGESNSGGNP